MIVRKTPDGYEVIPQTADEQLHLIWLLGHLAPQTRAVALHTISTASINWADQEARDSNRQG